MMKPRVVNADVEALITELGAMYRDRDRLEKEHAALLRCITEFEAVLARFPIEDFGYTKRDENIYP